MRKSVLWIVILSVLCLAVLRHANKGSIDTFDEFIGTNQPVEDTIFVSVASYRDAQCHQTIKDMYAKARRPERVFVGVCEQNSGDVMERCVADDASSKIVTKNIRRITMPHKEAKGPTYARYLCSTLYRGQTYYMQVDSHTTFVKDWDVVAISELHKTKNPRRSVLSTYPNDDTSYTISTKDVPMMCSAKFDQPHGLPTFEAQMKPPSFYGDKPRESAFVAGGFFFAPGRIIRDVPFQPNTPYIFQGEEILLSARFWTHGYDIYTPSKNICLHTYTRKDAPKFWTDLGNGAEYKEQKAESEKRVRRLLKLEGPPLEDPMYGLGEARSIEEFWAHAGLDPQNKKQIKSFCS